MGPVLMAGSISVTRAVPRVPSLLRNLKSLRLKLPKSKMNPLMPSQIATNATMMMIVLLKYWRIFDFFFMLHIMDYDERTDVHNPLLKVAQFTGVVFAITGIWLLFYSFTKRRKVAVKE